MKLWNNLPDNLRHLDLSLVLDIPLSAENASVLTESVAPSDIYFSALTKFTYLLYKRSNSNNTSFRAKL